MVEQVLEALDGARRVLFVTGAGISADSGLPTYRGVGGLYVDADPPEGMAIEQVLSGPVFRRNPALTWKYIRQIEEACRGAEPNAAHRAIAAMQDRYEVVVLTQNVDGLHHAAGSRDVIAIHGDVHALRCTQCRWATRVDDYTELDPVPRCPDCGGVVRPDVVLFEEMLPTDALRRLEREVTRGFDVVFSVGTSAMFPYIAWPTKVAHSEGKPTVEIDLADTGITPWASIRWRARAAEALGSLLS